MELYCDCEVYVNYFLVSFKSISGKPFHFEKYKTKELDIDRLRRVLSSATIITFNGIYYDIPILTLALSNASCKEIKNLSDIIINNQIKPWELNNISLKHIDLMNIAPGKSSLKMYGARLNAKTLQDLPIEPSSTISPAQRTELKLYCENDLTLTQLLHKELLPALELRKAINTNYHMRVMSDSDQKIGEKILRNYLLKKDIRVFRPNVPHNFKYDIPKFINVMSDDLKKLLPILKNLIFSVGESGKPTLPQEVVAPITIAEKKYKMGIGGLHSMEKMQIVKSTKGQNYEEFDVTSMYPAVIICERLYPKHLGKSFIDCYKTIFDVRVNAKKNKDSVISDTYKLILNSAFGKFGSRYSFLYSPKLLIQVTLTGQLSLLMLIEMLTAANAEVMSANTDGINVLYDKRLTTRIKEIVLEWELITGYNLECTSYLESYSRDVNNHFIIKLDGTTKGIGIFAKNSLKKNFASIVCVEAAKNYIKTGADYFKHIRNEIDIKKFLTIRTVAGGAMWHNKYLGKVVRWYYSVNGDNIVYKKNGNNVPKTDWSRPMMTLTNKIPGDLDYEKYYTECEEILSSLGVKY